jgi:hypothetical protein
MGLESGLPWVPSPYMDEVLVSATDYVVIRHSDGVDTAARCLQDVDAVEGPDVPDLGASVATWSQAKHIIPRVSGAQCISDGRGRTEGTTEASLGSQTEGETATRRQLCHTLIVW